MEIKWYQTLEKLPQGISLIDIKSKEVQYINQAYKTIFLKEQTDESSFLSQKESQEELKKSLPIINEIELYEKDVGQEQSSRENQQNSQSNLIEKQKLKVKDIIQSLLEKEMKKQTQRQQKKQNKDIEEMKQVEELYNSQHSLSHELNKLNNANSQQLSSQIESHFAFENQKPIIEQIEDLNVQENYKITTNRKQIHLEAKVFKDNDNNQQALIIVQDITFARKLQ